MPQANIIPDEIITDSFKILSRQHRRSPHRRHHHKEHAPHHVVGGSEQVPPPETHIATPAHPKEILAVEEILASRKSSSHSIFSSQHSDSRDDSRGFSMGDDTSISIGSVLDTKEYMIDHNKNMRSKHGSNHGIPHNPHPQRSINSDASEVDGDPEKKKRHNALKKKLDDRRRSTWIPCTFPQYKVSKDLAMRRDVQAIFFAKLIVIKVVQLLIINLVVFSVAFERGKTLRFFKKSHDWVYLAYALFVAIFVCIRVGMTYRARWPMAVSFTMLVPQTAIISFTSSCVAVVYNTVLVPIVTCTILLTFIMMCFVPYLLRKFVMSRVTNFVAAGLTVLSSIILIFLKEFEASPMTYWEFISHVWLPAMMLSMFVVQASIIEIQRMFFGLCFNVSSKRWHIAAMYL